MSPQHSAVSPIERKVIPMASLRQIRGESLAEQNRIRWLLKRGAAFTGTPEEEFTVRVESALSNRHIRVHDLEGDRSQTELALVFLCTVLAPEQDAAKELAELLGFPPEDFSAWPPLYVGEMLERVRKHGCSKCQWLDEKLCLQSEEEDNFPEECPGKELVALVQTQ